VRTPWGDAIDYEKPAVREFAIRNALMWATEYHVDGLRLDATHAIADPGEPHLLAEMRERIRGALPAEREFVLIAEDERNERALLLPPPEGLGLDAVWADDVHHVVRRLTAGDSDAYFADYAGSAEELAAALRRGWLYEGQRSEVHGGPRGTSAEGIPAPAFVHCIQNHDQVGNRAFGDRLTESVGLPVFRAASALLLLSPFTPLLWMGQEWAATSPFRYFTDHPEELGRLVTEGRRREFGRFAAFADPALRERIPDPQDPATFDASRLRWEERSLMPHAGVVELYRELLRLRREHPALRERGRDSWDVVAVGDGAVGMRRRSGSGEAVLVVAAFGGAVRVDTARFPELGAGEGRRWEPVLATEEGRFGGEVEGRVVTVGRDGVVEVGGAGAVVLEGVGERVLV
jgi:maltooligosyltrehalose trehalohydrolase